MLSRRGLQTTKSSHSRGVLQPLSNILAMLSPCAQMWRSSRLWPHTACCRGWQPTTNSTQPEVRHQPRDEQRALCLMTGSIFPMLLLHLSFLGARLARKCRRLHGAHIQWKTPSSADRICEFGSSAHPVGLRTTAVRQPPPFQAIRYDQHVLPFGMTSFRPELAIRMALQPHTFLLHPIPPNMVLVVACIRQVCMSIWTCVMFLPPRVGLSRIEPCHAPICARRGRTNLVFSSTFSYCIPSCPRRGHVSCKICGEEI